MGHKPAHDIPRQVTASSWIRFAPLIPPLLAFVLSIPCLRLSYVWDDLLFLRRALTFGLSKLLPNPVDDFWRPVSRDLYFAFVSILGPHKIFLAHVLNGLILALIVLLLIRVVSRLAGKQVGFLAGLLFASLGQTPLLVAWVSGSQDLFAILFFLIALYCRIERRDGFALVAMILAILSKETAIALIPVVVLFDWIAGRKPYRVGSQLLRYGVAVGLWAAMHPGVRHLFAHRFQAGATDYIGVESRWFAYFWQYLLTSVNIPVAGLGTQWPRGYWAILVAGIVIALAGLRISARADFDGSVEAPISKRRLAFLALLMTIPTLLLTSVVVRHWFPYYAVIGGIGSAFLLALVLSRAPVWAAAMAITCLLFMGVWSRTLEVDPDLPSEQNFRTASEVLGRIREGFHKLRPTLPLHSQVVVSVQARGSGGAYWQTYVLQPLQVWYEDPTLQTVRPEARTATTGPEFLFLITPGLDVVEIDPQTLSARSSGEDPDYAYCERAVRAYALGLFGSGEADRAAQLLIGMPELSANMENAHHRLAAALLLASGRKAEADSVLRALPPVSREYALSTLTAFLAEPLRGSPIDSFALATFGIADDDDSADRHLMEWFEREKYHASALRFAERLGRKHPEDLGLAIRIERLRALSESERAKLAWFAGLVN